MIWKRRAGENRRDRRARPCGNLREYHFRQTRKPRNSPKIQDERLTFWHRMGDLGYIDAGGKNLVLRANIATCEIARVRPLYDSR